MLVSRWSGEHCALAILEKTLTADKTQRTKLENAAIKANASERIMAGSVVNTHARGAADNATGIRITSAKRHFGCDGALKRKLTTYLAV